ncbi:hypothetical protein D0Z08_31105 [Nocardioides immobilis]|uniref:Uncharacterized protein n=1 Tax=Nocardioides immobilis TaxID=2049295 RepID=A0A417XSD2_9ACTN|nr:hypothetical protein [Nocardioides immobilis]RHW22792.1 hypothetical protein D0Z08_31105 [Nocardioides immobilis]
MTSTGDADPDLTQDASDPLPAVPRAVQRSRALWRRARAARDAAEGDADALLASARADAAEIRRSSERRVGPILAAADQDVRDIVAAAEAEAGRIVAAARAQAPAAAAASAGAAWLLVAWTLLSTAVIVVGQGGPLAVAAAVAVSVVCPGLGIVLALGRAAGPDRGVTMVLLSVCWSGAVALLCAWTTLQQPMVQYGALVAPALVGAAVAIRRGRASTERPSPSTPPGSRSGARTGARAGCVLLLAGASAYAVSLVGSREEPIGEYGLLPTLGPWFVAAVILAVAAVVVACLLRPVWAGLGTAGLVAVGLLFTPPRVLFDHNLLAGWAYKHLGVVDLIVQQQPLQDPRDVYQQWPGFFAVAAQVQVISGADPLTSANLAQPLLVAMAGVGLAAAVHRLFGGVLTPIVATLLFLCTMWAGQFYYSPQTMCFALVMLCLAHVVTLLKSLPQDRLRTGWFGRSCGWALRDLPASQPLEPVARGVLVATVVATYLLIVVSHQITPYVLVLQLAPAALAGWLAGRWRWGYVVLATLPLLWLYLHREALSTNAALTGFSFANAQSLVTGPSSDAQELAATAARIVAALVLGGGALSALTYLRRFGTVLLPVMFAVMPVFVLLGGNYGGEAPYRVWLFASPWFCALIAKRVCDPARRRAAAVVTVGVLSVGTFLASAQATSFGMYPFLRVSDDEVAASRWLSEETPPGSTIVHLTRTFPGRISAGYAERNPLHTINDPALIDYPQFDRARLLSLSMAELHAAVIAEFGDRLYLVLARSMEEETRYYGALPEGAVLDLAGALAASPYWTVAYANNEVWVFAPR